MGKGVGRGGEEGSRRRRRALRLSALLAILSAWATQAAGGRPPIPRDLEVEVAFGRESGSTTLLEEISAQAVETIGETGCYRSIRAGGDGPAATGADLLLRIVLDEIAEETIHDVSLAEREGSQEPGLSLRVTGIVRADVRLEILAAAGSDPIRARKLHIEARVRPRMFDEDVRESARRRAVEDLVERVRSFACRLRAKHLPKGDPEASSR